MLAAAILALLVNVLIAAGERNDMDIFLQASADLRAGRNAYLLRYNEWYRYFYSPFFALAIAPLEWLGAAGAKWLWGLGIIALMLRSACDEQPRRTARRIAASAGNRGRCLHKRSVCRPCLLYTSPSPRD